MGDELVLSVVPTVRVAMLVRRPVHEVFESIVDPDVTTRLWFSHSTGRLVEGATVTWTWECYGVSAEVAVRDVVDDALVRWTWRAPDGEPRDVEVRFAEVADGTYVTVTESGLRGTGDELVAHVADSTGGFTLVLAAMKALLEHGVELGVVKDHFPSDAPG